MIYMCAYAGDVLRGELQGPYTDHDAVRYARAALIPDRLPYRPGLDVGRVARAFGIPASELAAARDERGRETAA